MYTLQKVYLVLYRWEGDFILCGPFFCQEKFLKGLGAVCGSLGEVKGEIDVHSTLGSQEEWVGGVESQARVYNEQFLCFVVQRLVATAGTKTRCEGKTHARFPFSQIHIWMVEVNY